MATPEEKPVVSALPPAPSRANDGPTFSSLADAFVAALSGLVSQVNAVVDWISDTVSGVNENAEAAANAAQVVNYQGAWSSGQSYTVGQTVSNDGRFWVAQVANSNSEPADGNANWMDTGSIDMTDFLHLPQSKSPSLWARLLAAKADLIALPTPSLDLDFEKDIYKVEGESDTFANTVTYTRADAVASKYHASGKLATVGVDTPQFEYDPDTGERYLLLEPSRTNLLTYSEEFDNASWANGLASNWTNAVVTANTATAPDGTTTADTFHIDGLLDSRSQLVSTSSNTKYIASVWLKLATASEDVGSGLRMAIANTNGGALSGSVATQVVTLTTEWQRYEMEFTTASSGTDGVTFVAISGFGGGTTPNADIHVWGAQLEEGSYPTSYIKTVASTVSRTGPAANAPITEWFNANEGTFLIDVARFDAPIGSPSGFQILFDISDGTGTNRLRLFRDNGSGNVVCSLTKEGVIVFSSIGLKNVVGGEGLLAAVSYSTQGARVTYGDQTTFFAADCSGLSFTKAGIGTYFANGGDFNLGGAVSQFKYYPKALTEAQLVVLTSA